MKIWKAVLAAAALLTISGVISPCSQAKIHKQADLSKLWLAVDLTANKLVIMCGDKEIKGYPICGPRKDTRFYNFVKERRQVWAKIQLIDMQPDWTPPENVKKRALAEGRILKDYYPPGSSNAMGAAKIKLNIPGYKNNVIRIHGTDNPSSVGKNESSGCPRLKNKNILKLIKAIGGPKKGVGKLVLFVA